MASGTVQKHTALFGRLPEAILSAPGRTELCGNHTDHQSGRVIAAAIRRSITAAGFAARGRQMRAAYGHGRI